MGVRALLVVRDQRIVGLITSYDIQGERTAAVPGSRRRILFIATFASPIS